ncbi:putative short-chain dehydrogenase/reductase family protein [Sclerotinia borealis F-4128]|uniref:Putative short-chain dehydrogenase/reductase family protein n=1 Tax=Sclerotinia borealis (strain F-4128) TaxID=1432307 RepID=W9C4B0_SCLBF|nr:putative short-chain dehydrogenase/reductase family protein [Sclerotinia borealis F-4128]
MTDDDMLEFYIAYHFYSIALIPPKSYYTTTIPKNMAAAIPTQIYSLPLFITPEICRGRTYIVTGANAGLGFEAAKHLVRLGSAIVIMGVRNLSYGHRALADIESSTEISGVAQVWELDLSSYNSVTAFTKRAIEKLDRVDAVIQNAGVATFAAPKIEGDCRAEQSTTLTHLVIVTSRACFDFEEDWMKIKDNPIAKLDEEEMITLKAYPLSKLFEVMSIRHITSLLPVSRSGAVINLVCPGLCKTDLGRSVPPGFCEKLAKQKEQYGRTAEDGSRTLLYGAVAGEESHGSLLDSCTIAEKEVPSWITDEEIKKSQKLVWDAIARELETIEPGCVERILQG